MFNAASDTADIIVYSKAGSDAFPHHIWCGDEGGEKMDRNVSAEHHSRRQLRQPETHTHTVTVRPDSLLMMGTLIKVQITAGF